MVHPTAGPLCPPRPAPPAGRRRRPRHLRGQRDGRPAVTCRAGEGGPGRAPPSRPFDPGRSSEGRLRGELLRARPWSTHRVRADVHPLRPRHGRFENVSAPETNLSPELQLRLALGEVGLALAGAETNSSAQTLPYSGVGDIRFPTPPDTPSGTPASDRRQPGVIGKALRGMPLRQGALCLPDRFPQPLAFRLLPVPGAGECWQSRGRRGGTRPGAACSADWRRDRLTGKAGSADRALLC